MHLSRHRLKSRLLFCEAYTEANAAFWSLVDSTKIAIAITKSLTTERKPDQNRNMWCDFRLKYFLSLCVALKWPKYLHNCHGVLRVMCATETEMHDCSGN
jgi:hypothetical protein